ncbi:hypothetical protein CCR97_29040, partial [Rhodoplanes elegans]|uniref:hypothetical protein n=1 Tax=Rhodoplanes elegans TaxID=29408 RepID=UPI00191388E4
MYKRPNFEVDQEITEEDYGRLARWPQEGISRLTDDLLVSGRLYKGFTTVATSQSAVEVAAGRLYDAGAMYALEAALPLSVAEWVPITLGVKVWVVLIGQGREDDGYVEARNYEREVAVSGGGTAIQQVPATGARARVRSAIVTPYPGSPSAIP